MPVKEKSQQEQSDFMLFLSAYARHLPKGLRDLTSQRAHAQAGSADRRPATTGPLLCLQFLKNIKFIMNDVTVTGEYWVDAKASVHSVCALEFVGLSCILLSDTRCTDSDRKWSWHWLSVQSQPQELQDKLPLLMSWLQQAIILHAVMKGIHLWRLFPHLGDHWASEAVLEDFNFCYWQ